MERTMTKLTAGGWLRGCAAAAGLLLGSAPAAAGELSIVTLDALSFGKIVVGTSPGSVTITPLGVRSAAGGCLLAGPLGGAVARFRVEGDPDAAFSIVVPASAVLSGAAGSMTVDDFVTAPAGGGVLGPDGRTEITLGATLQVGSSQGAGAYSGSFDLTVAYP